MASGEPRQYRRPAARPMRQHHHQLPWPRRRMPRSKPEQDEPSSTMSHDASKQPFPPLTPEDGDSATNENGYPENDGQDATSPVYDHVDVEEADFQSHYSHESQSLSDASSDSDEGPPDDNLGMHHHSFRQSTSSLHGPNAFAPPFYNRPPTPLPPSPSLTSLLRPPFSATTSRPTTPDGSDVETPDDTEAAVAKSAQRATTVPRASPKVPTYEYYGFVLYLASSLAFCKSFLPMM